MPPRKRVKKKSAKLGKPGFTITPFEMPKVTDYVVAELRYESPVAYTRSRFAAPAPGARDAERLNQVLAKFDVAAIRPQFGLPATEVRKRVGLAAALPSNPSANILKAKGADAVFRQSGFVQIIPKRGEDSKKLATALYREKAIWRRGTATGARGTIRRRCRSTPVRARAGLPLFGSSRHLVFIEPLH